MTEPYYSETFGGIDKHVTEPTVPGDYRAAVGAQRGASAAFPSFAEVLGELSDQFGATKTAAFYHDEERDEYVEVPARAVLVNPAWLGDGLEASPQDSAGWTTVSDSYGPTTAMDNYGPLVALARQRDHADAFGHVRGYRNGGDVVMEVFFNELTATDPDSDEPRYVLGFETGYDYFKSTSVYASVIAFDLETGAILRRLSDTYSTAHRGDTADRVVAWFEVMFDRAEKVGETLYEVVAEARTYEVDLATMPVDAQGFYEALGLPSDVARKSEALLVDPRQPTAWGLYEALSTVLTNDYDVKVGGWALTTHAGTANDLLYTPAAAERKALRSAADRLAGQDTLTEDDRDARDQLRDRANSLDDAVKKSKSFRQRVRTMLDDIGKADAEADAENAAENGGEAEEAEA